MGWNQVIPGVFELNPEIKDGLSEISEIHIKMSHIPPETYQTRRFSNFRPSKDIKLAIEAAKAFPPTREVLPFLTFLGEIGTGKTHLALAIGWEWLEAGKGVLYYHVVKFLDALREGYSRQARDDYNAIISFAENCTLLILDDLGVEKETEWATQQLDYIVDYRYEHCKPLVVTSNLALTKLPPRIADRLREGQVFVLKGPSYRKQK